MLSVTASMVRNCIFVRNNTELAVGKADRIIACVFIIWHETEHWRKTRIVCDRKWALYSEHSCSLLCISYVIVTVEAWLKMMPRHEMYWQMQLIIHRLTKRVWSSYMCQYYVSSYINYSPCSLSQFVIKKIAIMRYYWVKARYIIYSE